MDNAANTEIEIISTYTREQALEDGVLVDVTEWASADKGFIGGFACPVALTQALFATIEAIPTSLKGIADVRGRAHDVLWMASLAVRSVVRGRAALGKTTDQLDCQFTVILPSTGTRKRNRVLRVSFNSHEGFTIGFPEDF